MILVRDENISNLAKHIDENTLIQDVWEADLNGKTHVCMMSALVPGAKIDTDCVTAGWPSWLVKQIVDRYDRISWQDIPDFTMSLAIAFSKNIDYDVLRDKYLIYLLNEGDYSVKDLVRRLQDNPKFRSRPNILRDYELFAMDMISSTTEILKHRNNVSSDDPTYKKIVDKRIVQNIEALQLYTDLLGPENDPALRQHSRNMSKLICLIWRILSGETDLAMRALAELRSQYIYMLYEICDSEGNSISLPGDIEDEVQYDVKRYLLKAIDESINEDENDQ